MRLKRIFRHLIAPGWLARRRFRYADREAIRAAVAASEACHRGEIRVAIEGPMPLRSVLQCHTPHQRAAELFLQLGVGATKEATGILIYVQLVDRCIEILADHGIDARVPQEEWEAICRELEVAFSEGAWRRGVLEAIDRVGRLLQLHFPARRLNLNELDDRPMLF